MARLADLLEDYRNLIGRANWSIGRDIDAMSGYDPDLAEFVERSSLGTGSHGLGAGGLAGMIKASHGSPHAFERFDLSKIGTGEGAQAYGHGGYFAQGFDSPVANMYADALGSKNQDLVSSVIDRVVKAHGGDTTKIKSELLNAGLPGERITPELETTISRIIKGTDPSDGSVSRLALNEYNNLENLVPNEKHLYNVELKWPDAAREAADPLSEHHLLDWDAPLSEQPQTVQDKFASLKPHNTQLTMGGAPYTDLTVKGNDVYNYLSDAYKDPRKASDLLRSIGIPGIRYLDQASRGAGTGSRNYVIFDQDIPNIVSRNGVSLSDLLRR